MKVLAALRLPLLQQEARKQHPTEALVSQPVEILASLLLILTLCLKVKV